MALLLGYETAAGNEHVSKNDLFSGKDTVIIVCCVSAHCDDAKGVKG